MTTSFRTDLGPSKSRMTKTSSISDVLRLDVRKYLLIVIEVPLIATEARQLRADTNPTMKAKPRISSRYPSGFGTATDTTTAATAPAPMTTPPNILAGRTTRKDLEVGISEP